MSRDVREALEATAGRLLWGEIGAVCWMIGAGALLTFIAWSWADELLEEPSC